ncbi:MAG TPA: GNAT family N-acetyltransferase [Dyella sp.]|uniref:GNAT family N-acetyltransferase n=1 Tax=Dyella sp. TaxID=1869338 RepID=UPI002D765154|nr:GNAT family N-acetyltransferase [Dyella sp.]HET6553650.1 GNAT family N-acetyltransferase [Dyella sp.]
MIEARFHDSIDSISAEAWDALRPDDNPFVSHAFLSLLERTGCIRPDWGWRAHHLGLYEHGTLVAAAPLYLKGNSHGEFVFDWSWASAWERAGGDYYPKLLNAVPYSPVPGPRLLAGVGPRAAEYRVSLTTAMRQFAARMNLSSVHANFLRDDELPAFDHDWLVRSDVQFHWHNHGYADFAGFLSALNHKKRKNIRQEREHVARSGLSIEWHGGDKLSQAEWRRIHELYEATFDAKGNHAALTGTLFSALGESLGDAVQVALARQGEHIVAMALFLQSHDTLYGRYWGADMDVPGLHFELCYYQGIEHAIKRGLQRFEPGAQGEHKLARGFLPVRTHSRHYLVNTSFRSAVREALAHETEAVDDYANELLAHTPYARHGTAR